MRSSSFRNHIASHCGGHDTVLVVGRSVVVVLTVVAILRAAAASATSGSETQPSKLHKLAATLSAINLNTSHSRSWKLVVESADEDFEMMKVLLMDAMARINTRHGMEAPARCRQARVWYLGETVWAHYDFYNHNNFNGIQHNLKHLNCYNLCGLSSYVVLKTFLQKMHRHLYHPPELPKYFNFHLLPSGLCIYGFEHNNSASTFKDNNKPCYGHLIHAKTVKPNFFMSAESTQTQNNMSTKSRQHVSSEPPYY
jgi:hypothetical protein